VERSETPGLNGQHWRARENGRQHLGSTNPSNTDRGITAFNEAATAHFVGLDA